MPHAHILRFQFFACNRIWPVCNRIKRNVDSKKKNTLTHLREENLRNYCWQCLQSVLRSIMIQPFSFISISRSSVWECTTTPKWNSTFLLLLFFCVLFRMSNLFVVACRPNFRYVSLCSNFNIDGMTLAHNYLIEHNKYELNLYGI